MRVRSNANDAASTMVTGATSRRGDGEPGHPVHERRRDDDDGLAGRVAEEEGSR